MQRQRKRQNKNSEKTEPDFITATQEILKTEEIDSKSKEFINECGEDTLNSQKKFYQDTIRLLPGSQLLERRSRLTMLDEIEERVSEYIDQHRVMNSSLMCYQFNTVVCGPPQSGKSLLLSLLTEQIIAEAVASNAQRSNFFFVFDAAQLTLYTSNISLFLPKYIEMVFQSLALQRPGTKKYSRLLSNYLGTVVFSKEDSIPPPPMQFVKDENFRFSSEFLYQFAARLHQCVLYQSEFEDWGTTVMMIPVYIAEAFGFKKVHFIIDNLEFMNTTVIAQDSVIELLECIKEVLVKHSYIVTGQNIDEIFALFGNLGAADLLQNSDYLTTIGFNGTFYGDNREFIVSFEGEPRNHRITPKHCCGCPAYLAMWEEVIYAYEENKEGAVDKMEFLLHHIFKDSPILSKPIKDIKPVSVVA